MVADVSVTGAEDFLALSVRLKQAGEVELRKELNKGIRSAAKPLISKTRAAFRSGLPQRGGLAAEIGRRSMRVKVSTNRLTPGVSIVATKTDPRIDEGRIAHPTFGRKPIVVQRIRPGLFSKTLEAEAPTVRDEVVASIDRMARRVTKEGI